MKAVSALVGLLAGGCAVIMAGAAIAGQNAAAAAPSGATGSCTLSSTAGLTTDQQPVAAGILTAAQQLGVSKRGITIAFAVALTESGMRSLGYGDMMGPVQANGSRGMSSSRGAFQQLDAWGPLADRLDPVKSARMFFDGGQAGQRGLLDVPGWESMPMPQAAQAVQQSEFTDGSNFAAQMNRAGSLADGLTCPGGGSGSISPASYSGVSVTIPNSPHVAAAVRGKVIQAPSPAMARGIAAGFGALGLPYVWGGGTAGGGPDDGCARAGGEDNSCKGLTGFDCSGLTAYVLKQAGYGIPTNSGAQRTSGQSVPYAAGQPGDIVGFPGHVAIYLGTVDGLPYILEASTFGVPVHVVALTRTDRDSVLHRYYGTAAA